MKHFTMIVVAAAVLPICGCAQPRPSNPGADPSSNAPALEGRWCLEGAEQGFVGFFRLDETGDPIRLEDNPVVRDELEENEIILDGRRHATRGGLEYSAIARASLEGTLADIFVEVHVFADFGFEVEVGALALQFEGERVSSGRLEGITVTIQDFPNSASPPLIIQRSSANKDSCD